jgi:hypothetical protein
MLPNENEELFTLPIFSQIQFKEFCRFINKVHQGKDWQGQTWHQRPGAAKDL